MSYYKFSPWEDVVDYCTSDESCDFLKLYIKYEGNVDRIPGWLLAERDEVLKESISNYTFSPNKYDERVMKSWAYIY